MMEAQAATGGFVPATDEEDVAASESVGQAEAEKAAEAADATGRFNLEHQSLAWPALRLAALGSWMFLAVMI
jgi:hypothetical protein